LISSLSSDMGVEKMPQKLLGSLGSGEQVFDRVDSHLSSHPVPSSVLSSALARILSGGRASIREEVQFSFTVGNSGCVETNANDKICYAVRRHGNGASRFVIDRNPQPCSSVTVKLGRSLGDSDVRIGDYILRTAYIGKLTPPEPWSKDAARAPEESLAFWNSHAIIWGSQPVVSEPTPICAW
jgi:hypothetical protein